MDYVCQVASIAKDWQTLLAGLIALLAAYVAARPVWRQLHRMEQQSKMMLREILIQRLGEVQGRRTQSSMATDELVDSISRDIGWWDETDTQGYSAEWAFGHWQMTTSVGSRFEAIASSYRDTDRVESAKSGIKDALSGLGNVLDDIHRPESTHQHDDDHDIPDDEWAKIEARAEAAKAEVAGAVAALRKSAEALSEAYDKEIQSLRDKLREVDDALLPPT